MNQNDYIHESYLKVVDFKIQWILVTGLGFPWGFHSGSLGQHFANDGKLKYDNNVHFEGTRFICNPHLAIIGRSEARANLMVR